MIQVIYYIIKHNQSGLVCYTNKSINRAKSMLEKLEPNTWHIEKFDIITKEVLSW